MWTQMRGNGSASVWSGVRDQKRFEPDTYGNFDQELRQHLSSSSRNFQIESRLPSVEVYSQVANIPRTVPQHSFAFSADIPEYRGGGSSIPCARPLN